MNGAALRVNVRYFRGRLESEVPPVSESGSRFL